MARYGSGKNYNSSTNYGASAASEAGDMLWQLLFDWNNDGTLDSTNESFRLKGVSIDRGRSSYFAQGGGFEHVRPGRMRLVLDNFDRRYDPRYASSALYPNVKPGRKVYLAVTDLSANVSYPIFTGLIDDIIPVNGSEDVNIECVDYMAVLNDQPLTSEAESLNTAIPNAMMNILIDAHYPGSQSIEVDSQPVILSGLADQNAGQAMHELADAGMGSFFVDANGIATFHGRAHSYPAGTALDEDYCLKEILVTQPWAEVYNHITVMANRPICRRASVIYFLPGPIQITANVPLVVNVSYASALSVQLGDYEAWSEKTGTGTQLAPIATADLKFNGGTVTVTCTSNGWLTKLEIRGRSWGFIEEKYTSEDTTSQTAYGMRRFVLNSQFLQDPNYATNHAGAIKTFAKDDRESVTVQIEGRENLQFGFDLMDPVAFTAASLDIDATYNVLGIRHDWLRDTGQGVLTTLVLGKIIFNDTAVTAAETLSEPAEEPSGYQDPSGDPETPPSDDDPPPADDYVEPDDVVDIIETELGFEHIGDLLVGSDNSGGWDNLAVGTDAMVLTADSTEPLGVKWAIASSGSGGLFCIPYVVLTAGSPVYFQGSVGVWLEDGKVSALTAAIVIAETGVYNFYLYFYDAVGASTGNLYFSDLNLTATDVGSSTQTDIYTGTYSVGMTDIGPFRALIDTGPVVAGSVVTVDGTCSRINVNDTAGDDVYFMAFVAEKV